MIHIFSFSISFLYAVYLLCVCVYICTCMLMFVETQCSYLESFSQDFSSYSMKQCSSVKHGVQWWSYSCLQACFRAPLSLFSKSIIIIRPSCMDSEDLASRPHCWMASANSFVTFPGLHVWKFWRLVILILSLRLKQALAIVGIWLSHTGLGC